MIIKIDKLDNEGKGIGYYKDKIIFVEGTLVGETVKVSNIVHKNNCYFGKLEEVIEASPLRIKKVCPYSDKCGGCSFDHISFEDEISIKVNNLKDLFKRNNLIVNDIETINSNTCYNYRNKISLKIDNGSFGYYDKGSHSFCKIDSCLLAKDSINKVIKDRYLFNVVSGDIVIRSNYNDEILIKITSDYNVNIDIDKLKLNNKIVGIIVNDKVIYGNDYFFERVNGKLFKVNINSFFQVNLQILDKISKILSNRKYSHIVDLYCGVGVLGIFTNHDKLYGIEINESSIFNAIFNGSINNQDNTYMLGDSSLISKINDEIDTIIVDPPRSGLSKDTTINIIKRNPDNIIYMSCNPFTLVRDLKLLNKYKINKVYMLGMFPRTKHIETICILERTDSL